MGISLTSIHIYGNTVPVDYGNSFRSFSPNWITCTDNFDENDTNHSYKFARTISKQINAPVLRFSVFDSEEIWFEFFLNGKVVSRYSDDTLTSNKKLFDIPSLIGYDDGHKKQLSSILSCSDTETKISMLEEYFGVCLLFHPDLLDESDMLFRERTDKLYKQYQAEEKALTGKAAPIKINLVSEYPGKLFYSPFGKDETFKPHFFLHGYTFDDPPSKYHKLTPVQFTGNSLEVSTSEIFEQDRIPLKYNFEDSRFLIHYGTPDKVTFSEECPHDYSGKTMNLPNGFYPEVFLPSGELLLLGNRRIFVIDQTLKIVAKLSIKGDFVDIIGNYILVTTGESFSGYCYEPKAKIYIYEIVRK